VASPPVAAVTVAVAADSLPVADEVASATVVDAAVVVVALVTAVEEEAAVARPVVDVELPAVAAVTAAVVEELVVERTSILLQAHNLSNHPTARSSSSPIATPVSSSLAARRISSSLRT
jgi:hypothetical protein